MSKETDGNFTKSLVESNEIFAEAIRLLQEQIKKVTTRLEGLERDLSAARSLLKNKNIEILRLKEIIKTYEEEQKHSASKSDQIAVDQLLPQIKDLSDTIKVLQASMNKTGGAEKLKVDDKENYEYEEVEVEDEEFNSLVDELESRKLEIQLISQEKDDLIEEKELLKSKVVLLEKNIEELSESKISVQFNELLKKYDDLSETNQALEKQVIQLQEQISNVKAQQSLIESNDHASSLKNEVSKFIKQNDELGSLEGKLNELTEENQLLASNLEHTQSSLLKLQEENQSLEQKVDSLIKENFDLTKEKTDVLAQLNEKEQEILDSKIKINQLEEKFDEDSLFDQETMEISDESDEEDQGELLLRISEMEMEEANWQDEKQVLMATIEQLKSSMKTTPSDESVQTKIQQQEHMIANLKNEIHELNQDIDEADAELKEIELENGVLRDRIADLESKGKIEQPIPNVTTENVTGLKDENTKLSYELKEKESKLEETTARLKSQEQKIEHLESLMDQERQLREKFEFLYSGLKSKLDKKELKREEDNINAKRQLEQVIKSINLSDEITELTTDEDESDQDEPENLENTSASDDLGRALENTSLYLSLIDKFLKPHVQITQLLKQGDWEINSLSEIVGLDRKKLLEVLREMANKKILRFDENKVWLLEENKSDL